MKNQNNQKWRLSWMGIWLIIAFGLGISTSRAQTTVQVGTGTSTSSTLPIYGTYPYSFSQIMYRAADLTAAGVTAGNISSLQLNLTTVGTTSANFNNWAVYLGTSTQAGFVSTNYNDWVLPSDQQEVFNGVITWPAATGWFTITFSRPFYWDGTSNLVLSVKDNAAGNAGTAPAFQCTAYTPPSGFNNYAAYYYNYQTTETSNPSIFTPSKATSTIATIPNLKLTFTAASACSGAPSLGTLTASKSTGVCATDPSCLSTFTSANPHKSGTTYLWESSSDNTNWSTIVGATKGHYYAAPVGTTMYYRLKATCSGSTTTTSSVSVTGNTTTACKCTPSGGTNTSYYIKSVSTKRATQNISKTYATYDASGYANLTGTADSIIVSVGDSITLSFSAGTSNYHFAWIDWNNNGVFGDQKNEYITTASGYTAGPTDAPVKVPNTQSLGWVTMRLAQSYIGGINACSNPQTYAAFKDFKIAIVPPASCKAPGNITKLSGTTTSATFTWTAPTTSVGVAYDYFYNTTGTNPAKNVAGTGTFANTATSGTISGLTPSTTYYVWFRSRCSSSDTSVWDGPYSIYTNYCLPTNRTTTTQSYYLNAINTAGAIGNFTYNQSSTTGSTSLYRDLSSSLKVISYPSQSYSLNLGFSYSAGAYTRYAVWVDWNDDYDFNDSLEIMYFSTGGEQNTKTITFNTPATAPVGNHRMRIQGGYYSYTATTPCGGYLSTYDYYNDFVDATLQIVAAPSCFGPTNLRRGIATPTSAQVLWSKPTANAAKSGYDIYATVSNVGPAFNQTPTATTAGQNDTITTLTGLTPSSTYYVYVRAKCTSTDSSYWSGPLVFYTNYCLPTNGTTTNQTYSLNQVSTNGALTNFSNPTGNSGSLSIYQDYSATFSATVYPAQAIKVNLGYNYSTANYSRYGIWVDWNDDLDFNDSLEIVYISTAAEANTKQINVTIPSTAPIGNHRMRVAAGYSSYYPSTACNTVSYAYYCDFEDYTLNVVTTPTCFYPVNLRNTALAKTSASFAWSIPPQKTPSTGYDYYISYRPGLPTSGTAATGTTATANDTTVNVTGLNPATTYYFYVRANCGATDGKSAWNGPVTIYTDYCTPVNTSTSHYAYTTGVTTSGASTNFTSTSGDDNCYADYYSLLNASAFRNQTVSVNITTNNYTSSSYNFGVYVDWNNDLDFADAGELVNSSSPAASSATLAFAIPSAQAYGDYRMRVYSGAYAYTYDACTSQYTYYAEWEDYKLTVIPTPTCFAPTAINVNSLTYTTANISWTPPTSLPSIGYEYYATTSTTAPIGSTVATGSVAVGTNTANISGLTPSANNYIYVRSNCGAVNGKSNWFGPVTVYTDYCTPSASSTTYFITNVTTTGGTSNLNTTTGNSVTNGSAIPGYTDYYKTVSFQGYRNGTINVTANAGSSTYGWGVWIDWNNDLDFADANEAIYFSTSYTTNVATSFTVASNQAYGDYRMRVGLAYISTGFSVCGTTGTNTQYEDFQDYKFVVGPTPTCFPPKNVVNTGKSATSMTMSWSNNVGGVNPSNGYQYYYNTTGVAPSSGTTPSGSVLSGDTTCTVNGLTTLSTVYFWVRANCGSINGQSSWTAGPSVYIGPCQPKNTGGTAPYYWLTNVAVRNAVSGFNNNSGTAGGTSIYTDNYASISATTYPGQTFQVDMAYNYGSTYVYYAIYVDWNNDFDFADAGETLYYSSPGVYEPSTGVTKNVTVPANTALGNYRMRVVGSYYYYTFDGCGPTGTVTYYPEYEDYKLIVGAVPTCYTPTGLTSGTVTPTSAIVRWNKATGNPSNGYQYYVSTTNTNPTAGTTPTGSTATATDTTVTLSGLTANTNYYVWVRSNCGSTSKSTWTTALNIYTGVCIPGANYTQTQYSISNVTVTGGYSTLNNNTATPSVNAGYQDFYNTKGFSAGANQTLSLAINCAGSGTHTYGLWIDWNNDLDFNDANENPILTTSYLSNLTATSFTVPAGQALGDYRMRVARDYYQTRTACGSSDNSTYIDWQDYKITIIQAPTCLVPTNLAQTSQTISSISFKWNRATTTASQGYEYYVTTSSTSPTSSTTPTGTKATNTDTTATVTGLTGFTAYNVWVRARCSSTDYSLWAGPISISTSYCRPTATASTYGITNVSSSGALVNINNTTGLTGGYGDYSSTVAMSAYDGTLISMTGVGSITSTNFWGIWVDWNNDLDFNDAGEAVAVNTTNSFGNMYNSLFVPFGTPAGDYRVRVGYNYYNAFVDACTANATYPNYSEYEDYKLTVLNYPACSGTPTPGGLNVDSVSLCLGTSVSLNLAGSYVSGMNYSWERSDDGTNWYGLSASMDTLYFNNFSTANVGAAQIVGNASISGGVCTLTPNLASQFGSILIPSTGSSQTKYKIDYDLNVSNSAGADGVSYSFGDDVNPYTDNGMNAENGTGSKLKVAFVTYTNGSSAAGIYLMYNCTTNEQSSTTTGVLAYSSDVSWRGTTKHFTIVLDSIGRVTVKMGNTAATATALTGMNNVQLPASYLSADRKFWKHCFKARTGAVTSIHAVDNFTVTADGLATGTTYAVNNYNGVPRSYRLKVTCTTSGDSAYSDPSYVFGPSAPAAQDKNITLVSRTDNTITFSFTAAAGVSGRVIKINTSNSFTQPTDGISYTGNTVYQGLGEQVIYAGFGTSNITVTNLNASTTYFVRCYTYSDCGGTSINYNGNVSSANPRSISTLNLDTMRWTYTPSGVTYNSILNANGPVSGASNPSWKTNYAYYNTSYGVALPFNFTYQGQSVNAFQIGSTGFITFDTTNTNTGSTNNLNTSGIRGMLAPFWDYLYFPRYNFANANKSIAYAVTGTAPNRVMTIEWANMTLSSSTTADVSSLNFQVKLYETSNNIEYIYGNMTPYVGGLISTSYSIGLNSFAPALGSQDVMALVEVNTKRMSSVDPANLTVVPNCYSKYLIQQGQSYQAGSVAADPGNDELNGAIALNVSPSSKIALTNCQRYPTNGATWSAGYPSAPCAPALNMSTTKTISGNTGGDRWYSFSITQVPSAFGIDVVGNSLVQAAFELYSDNGTALTYVACSKASALAGLASMSRTTLPVGDYKLRVYHLSDTVTQSTITGLGEYGIDVYAVYPPGYDNLSSAATLNITADCTNATTVYSIATSTSSSQPVATPVLNLKDNWHMVRANAAAELGGLAITVTPQVATLNAKMEVFDLGATGDTTIANNNTRIYSVTATGAGNANTFFMNGLTSGNYYAIRVYNATGGAGGDGTYTICATANTEYLNFAITKSAISSAQYASIETTGTSFNFKNAVNGDDYLSDSVLFPFAFQYAGRAVTSFKVCTNGWITLNGGKVTSTSANNNLLSGNSTSQNAIIAPHWDDLVAQGNTVAGLSSSMKYKVVGTAPNRVLIVEFIGMEKYNAPGSSINSQVRFYESNNSIDFWYGNSSFYDGTFNLPFSYSVGMNSFQAGTLGKYQVFALGSVGGLDFSQVENKDLAGSMPCYTRYQFVPVTNGTLYTAGAGESNITNNECSTALVLPIYATTPTNVCDQYSLKGATYNASVTNASNVTGVPVTYGKDVWFKFDVTTIKRFGLELRNSPGFQGGFTIYRGSCGSLTPLFNVADGGAGSISDSSFVSNSNTSYFIRVYENTNGNTTPAGNNGYFNLTVTELPTPPSNDECSNALLIKSYTTVPTTLPVQSVLNATTSTPSFCTPVGGPDLWYYFIPSYGAHEITAAPALPGTTFNPAMQIYKTNSTTLNCSTLVLEACQYNASANVNEVYSATNFVPGQVYVVRVYNQTGGKGGTGNFKIYATQPAVRDFTIADVQTYSANLVGTAGTTRKVRAVVKNNGPSAFSSASTVPVRLRLNGTTVQSFNPVLNTLAVGDTQSVYFTYTYTPTIGKIDTLAVLTDFAGEMNRTNDTLVTYFNGTSAAPGYSWARRFGTNLLDEANVVTTDANGNSIMAGSFQSKLIVGTDTINGDYRIGRPDVAIIKNDSAGTVSWVRGIVGLGTENIRAITTDASNNVYVAGDFGGSIKVGNVVLTSVGLNDGFLVKYNASGSVQYAIRFGGTGADLVKDMTINNSTNELIVVGSYTNTFVLGSNSVSSNGESDIYLASINAVTSAGNWVKSFGGYSSDAANAVTVDNSGNIYTTGYFCNNRDLTGPFNLSSSGIFDMYVSKHDNSGNTIWANKLSGTGSEYGTGLVVDNSGNVIVGGYFDYHVGTPTDRVISKMTQTYGAEDIFIARFTSAGAFSWYKTMGGTGSDVLKSMTVGKNNTVLATGFFQNNSRFLGYTLNSTGMGDAFVMSIDANGNAMWVNRSQGSTSEVGNDVSVAPSGSIYMVGSAAGSATFGTQSVTNAGQTDMFITKLVSGVANMISGPVMREALTARNMPVTESPEVNAFDIDWTSSAQVSNDEVIVSWSASHEIASSKFYIEQSANGIDWTIVRSISATNSDRGYTTRFNKNLLENAEVIIRVRMQTSEGLYSNSDVNVVNNVRSANENLIQVYPNPASDIIAIQSNNSLNDAMVVIRTVDGRMVRKVQVAGMGTVVEMPVSELSSGVYFLEITQNGATTTKRFNVKH